MKRLPEGYHLSISGASILIREGTKKCHGCQRDVKGLVRWDKGDKSLWLCVDCTDDEIEMTCSVVKDSHEQS